MVANAKAIFDTKNAMKEIENRYWSFIIREWKQSRYIETEEYQQIIYKASFVNNKLEIVAVCDILDERMEELLF